MNASPSSSDSPRATRLDALLGLCAAALGLIALVQVATTSAFQPLARAGSADRAGMLASVGEYTALTADIGNEDAMLLLDGRAEEILVYRADTQQVMQVAQRVNLPRMFIEARTRAGAKPPAAEPRDSKKSDTRANPPR